MAGDRFLSKIQAFIIVLAYKPNAPIVLFRPISSSARIFRLVLPGRLLHTGNETIAGHVPETDPADAEFAIDRPRPATQSAPQTNPDLLTRGHFDLFRIFQMSLQLCHLLPKLRFFRIR
jgi:hypothetical protein